MKISNLLLLLFFTTTLASFAGQNEKYLKDYLDFGRRNNLELQSAKATLNSYDAKVQQTFSNYLPKVDFLGRLTRAGGGREFAFPLSMFNPLIKAQPIHLDTLNDISEPFIRSWDQETKIEIVQPIFNMSIYAGHEAQKKQKTVANFEFKTKEMNFTYNVIEAYYNYARAYHAVEIRKSAVGLAKENYDVAKKLYAVDKVPKSDVLRAEVAWRQAEQEMNNANNTQKMAANYFNNTLNRNYDAVVNYDTLSTEKIRSSNSLDELKFNMSLEDAMELALTRRPELGQISSGIDVTNSMKDVAQSENYPTVGLAVDLGIQGEDYNIYKDSYYWTASAQLSWNIFNGFSTSAKQQEIEAQKLALQKSLESYRELIKLDVRNNFITYTNTLEQVEVAKKSYESAEENLILNKKRYAEGLNQYITLLDAENIFTQTRVNLYITYFDVLIAKAKLEKSMGIEQ